MNLENVRRRYLRCMVLLGIIVLALASFANAAPLLPDAIFFHPASMAEGYYPHQPIAGHPDMGPWTAVWSPADILALDPGRADISITGAEILPVLLPNPTSADGSYTAADLDAINVTNYMSYYMQKPGTDLSNPAVDYVADLTSSILTVTFKAPAMYAVRIKTLSRESTGTQFESRNYLYTEYVKDYFGEDGAADPQTANRKMDLPDADIYVVSDGDPNDNGFCDNAAKTLESQGKTVCRAKNLQEAEDCIKARSKALGRKVKVVMVGHGRPGSIKIGTERINGFADGVQTPAGFQQKIDDSVSEITFVSCDTAKGKTGDKFLQDFANSIGSASGWTVTVTAAAPVKNAEGEIVKAGYFDTTVGGKKGTDYAVRATEPIESSPTSYRIDSFFDVFYFGANDGFLYAQTTAGSIVPGFPVELRALELPGAVEPVAVRSRPAVYYGNEHVASLYFTTNQGHIVCLTPHGALRWFARPDPTAHDCSSTPAVTADGSLFVAINGDNGPRVWKLNASTGALITQTPPLALPTSDSSSIAVSGNLVYVGVTKPYPGLGSLFVLDTNLIIRSAGIAAGEGVAAPPFVNGMFMYDGTLAGNLYKINSVTTNPDPSFGIGGRVEIGEPMETSLYAVERLMGELELYAGTKAGRVYMVTQTGQLFPRFDSALYGPPAAIQGLAIVPSGMDHVMAFGAGHHFFQMPLSNPANVVLAPDRGLEDSGFSTAPTYAVVAHIFGIGNRDGYVYTFPRAF